MDTTSAGDIQTAASPAPVLSLRGIRKAYAVTVLSDVDLDLHAGEVQALLGANGAGKSTLTRIISGLAALDDGAMTLDGAPYAPATRRDAERAGVQLVMQESNLVATLDVGENLFLNRLPRRGWLIDRARLDRDARRALSTVGLDQIDTRTRAGALGVGHQQLVEVARALARPCHVLLLDEPTAALTAPEIARLFTHVRRLRDEGLAILYISHRLEEIRQIADRVTVLRDGRVVSRLRVADADSSALIDAMSAPSDARSPTFSRPTATRSLGEVVLRVEGLSSGRTVRDVTFDVRRGEILGLAGLVGSGRTETLRAIFGAEPRQSGRLTRGDGVPLDIASPRAAVRAGIGMVPEDRQAHALLLSHSIRVNVSLATVSRSATAHTWVNESREAGAVDALCTGLGVRRQSIEQPVAELSGGNQQKVVLARWLRRDCDVLLLDEPTRGIDVAAKQVIHERIEQLAAGGKAVVVVSSEIEELTALCDRIVVLAQGRVAGTFSRGEWNEPAIMAAAFAGGAAIPPEGLDGSLQS